MLDLNREKRVIYIPSAHVNDLVNAEIETAPLYAAVVDWLSYLGIAENIQTADLGKMGHQLHVRVDQIDKDHDLTNVGVGVSQVLPIIVMSLLAPSQSMLIFEQPELHLHPRVQSRLADFFLSMCLTQRQCLLETHSEHLIQRLRRRSAEAEEATISSKIRIYFTQKRGPSTVCEHVQVTKYGAIKNWPSDLFDQTQSETEKILMAAQEKFQKEATNRERAH